MYIKSMMAAALLSLAGTAQADVLYSQPWNGTSEAYSSQNDTTGGNGNFATAFDDFVITSSSFINGFDWTGVYFNPSVQAPIAGFTVTLYEDGGGTPGGAFASGFFTDFNETFLGSPDGFLTYSYSVDFSNFGPVDAGTYWLSIVPDMGFPPQWGWATSAVGNNNGYQIFLGDEIDLGVNFAFDIRGDAVIPEPATWAMMLIGFGGLGAAVRRTRVRSVTFA